MFDLYAINRVATLPGNLEKHEKPEFENLGKKTLKLRNFEKKTWNFEQKAWNF